MSTPTYKLRIKIGDAEFDAEGPQEIVEQSFNKFLDAAKEIPSTSTTPKASISPSPSPSPEIPPDEPIGPNILNRVFDVDIKKRVVSLRVLPPLGPNRAGDAGIMILYGAQVGLKDTELPVTRLKAGLAKSGIQVERVDRIMAPYRHVIIKSGMGVGGKYSLNNQGIAQAERLVRGIFG